MVAGSIEQMEKNVSASFGYVKKDILMVNDAISDLHDKIQHLSLNQAMLLQKVSNVEKLLSAKPVKAKKKAKAKKVKKVKTTKTKTADKKETKKKNSKTPKKIVTETVLYE